LPAPANRSPIGDPGGKGKPPILLPAPPRRPRETGESDADIVLLPTEMPIEHPASPVRRVNWISVTVGVLVLAFLGWLMYGWLRPLEPREVCERFAKARTAKEWSQYCTLNMQPTLPTLEALGKLQAENSEDEKFEFTQEGEAPAAVGGYFVGVRWQYYEPDVGRRIQLDGVIHLIKSDGWKIEDIYYLAVDGEPYPQAISWASNYQVLTAQQLGSNPDAQLSRPSASTTRASTQAKTWYNAGGTPLVSHGLSHLSSSKGAKSVGAALLAIAVAIGKFGKRILALFTSEFNDRKN
jgi:hypothetical protein